MSKLVFIIGLFIKHYIVNSDAFSYLYHVEGFWPLSEELPIESEWNFVIQCISMAFLIIRSPRVLWMPYRNQLAYLSIHLSANSSSVCCTLACGHSLWRVGVHLHVHLHCCPVTFDLEAVSLTLKIVFLLLHPGYWRYSLQIVCALSPWREGVHWHVFSSPAGSKNPEGGL